MGYIMPTNEERRDVAAKLHAIDREDFASSYSEEFEIIEKILGIYEDYDKFIWHVIADLIEPEHERTCHDIEKDERGYYHDFVCSECGEVYDESDDMSYRACRIKYCPNCGAMVVNE